MKKYEWEKADGVYIPSMKYIHEFWWTNYLKRMAKIKKEYFKKNGNDEHG